MSSLCSFIIRCLAFQIILILLTVHSLMDGLTEDAVSLATNGALKLVHFILVDAPPLAVWSLTVETVGQSTLGLSHDTFVIRLKFLFCNTLHTSKCIVIKILNIHPWLKMVHMYRYRTCKLKVYNTGRQWDGSPRFQLLDLPIVVKDEHSRLPKFMSPTKTKY